MSIAVVKSAGNPTLAFDSMPENVMKVGATYWTSFRYGTPYKVGLASAPDPEGPWTAYGGNPVLVVGGQAWETSGVATAGLDTSFLVEDAGTFYIFYSANDRGIGVATAAAVTGPYVRAVGNPVLDRGAGAAWDAAFVRGPSLLQLDDTTWVLAYSGAATSSPATTEKIGIATAATVAGPWTKDGGNPLLGHGTLGAWDDVIAAHPHIFQEDDGLYWMLYTGAAGAGGATPGAGFPWGVGMATAADPAGPWTKHSANPFLPPGSSLAWDAGGPFRGGVYLEGTDRWIIYAGLNGAGSVARGGTAVFTTLTIDPVVLASCEGRAIIADVYSMGSASAPAPTYLGSLCSAFDIEFLPEADGTGAGKFSINRYSDPRTGTPNPEVTAEMLGTGSPNEPRLVKVRVPAARGDDPVFAFFLTTGDFKLIDPGERGGEILTFGGPGNLSYIGWGVMDAESYLEAPFHGEDPYDRTWHLYADSTLTNYLVGYAQNGTSSLVSSWKLPTINPVGDDLQLIAFVGTRPGQTLTSSGWTTRTFKETVGVGGAAGELRYSMLDKEVDAGDPPYNDVLSAGGATRWSAAQLAFKRVAGSSPTVSASELVQHDPPVLNPTISKAIAAPAAGSVLVAYCSLTTSGLLAHPTNDEIGFAFDDNGATGTWENVLKIPNLIPEGPGLAAVAIKVADGTETLVSCAISCPDSVTSQVLLVAAYSIEPALAQSAGAILWRILTELQLAERPSSPVPLMTIDFSITNDSAGDAWQPTPSTAQFQAPVGESVLGTAGRLLGTGALGIKMDPDFTIHAYNRDNFGVDRTGAEFGAGVVRFERTVNIREAVRKLAAGGLVTHDLVQGAGDLYGRAEIDGADDLPHREGFLAAGSQTEVAALNDMGRADLLERLRHVEAMQMPVPIGDDPENGLYMPFKHFDVGDYVTVLTGVGDQDYIEQRFQIASMVIREGPTGELKCNLELGSTISFGGGSPSGGPSYGGGITAPPGGGSTAGSTGRLPWFNVRDYGATGRGTIDDRSSINRAIAALNSAGRGVLYFPAGEYLVSGALTALDVPCLVLGDGRGESATSDTVSMIHFTSATASCFTVTSDSVSFSRLGLYNSAVATAGAGITVSSGGNLAVYDAISVVGFYINIDIQEGGLWTMRDCYIRQSHKYGVKLRNNASPDGGDWSMVGCYIVDGANGSDAAIRYESGGGGKIINCKINSNALGFLHGIDLRIPNGVVTSDFEIANCSIENYRGDGIHLETAAGAFFTHITIVGNQIAPDTSFNTTGNGIAVVASTAGDLTGIVILGNSIKPNGVAASTGVAVKLTKADRVIVGPMVWSVPLGGFVGGLSQSGSTNVSDYTGGVAAGVAISGTPTAGQIPIAVSGASAPWATPTPSAPVGADYLVGTANPDLTGEIVVGTTPSGDLAGTWAAPTVAKINGSPLGTISAPALSDRLRWNGSAWVNSALIWSPVMVLDPGTGNYLVLTDLTGNPIMAEV